MQFIKDKKLANGLMLTFTDCSKPLVADRWFVKMQGEVKFPLTDAAWPEDTGDDPDLLAMIKEQLGDSVSYILCKERNFVAADEKETILEDLVNQVEKNLVGYLSDPSFPQKLFTRHYEETKQKCMVERQQPPLPINDEDDSAADFSACFRD